MGDVVESNADKLLCDLKKEILDITDKVNNRCTLTTGQIIKYGNDLNDLTKQIDVLEYILNRE